MIWSTRFLLMSYYKIRPKWVDFLYRDLYDQKLVMLDGIKNGAEGESLNVEHVYYVQLVG